MPLRLISSRDELVRPPDIVIVGSGIVGLATAFFCSRLGMRPLVIERLPAPAALTSRRSGEGVRAQWGLAHNIAIASASIAFYRDFARHMGEEGRTAGYRPVGYLYASRTAAGAAGLAARVRTQRALGLDTLEYLDGPTARSRFPILADTVEGAAFNPTDGIVVADAILAGYRNAADGEVLLGVEVGRVTETADGVCVETSAGPVEAAAAVIASGPRFGAMLRAHGFDADIRNARSSLLFLKVAGVPQDHPATVDVELGSFWRPNEDGVRITASFRDTLFVEDGIDDPPADPDYFAHAIATVAPLVPRWRDWARDMHDCHMRSGALSTAPDGSPMFGLLPGTRRIYVNGAYGGHGIMMSPEGARRLAGFIAAGGEPSAANPFSPSRFIDGRPVERELMTIHVHGAPKDGQ